MELSCSKNSAITRILAIASLAVFSNVVTAHGDLTNHAGRLENHGHSSNASVLINGPDYLPTYFALVDGRSMIYAHIVLMVVAWVFLLPVAVMLSIARSRLTLPSQIAFTLVNALGVFFAYTYNSQTPDLYPNNAHHLIGWVATLVLLTQLLIGVIGRSAEFIKYKAPGEKSSAGLIPHEDSGTMLLGQAFEEGAGRSSYDSGQGTELGTQSLRSSSLSTLDDEDTPLNQFGDNEQRFPRIRQSSTTSPVPGLGTLKFRTNRVAVFWIGKCLGFLYRAVDRVILPLGFITITTGIATFGRFFEGQAIFSGLAHWIKGGVFFWLGLLTLGRWSGCFAELGWAWNLTPMTDGRAQRRPSAELIESGLIFFYGSTNVFLEHLGAWGEEWSPEDLEHLSITILFIGGGLCGMLVESATVRALLNTTASAADLGGPDEEEAKPQWDAPRMYKVSMNPVPALVILLLGIMMSSHRQATMISSMVHNQWGSLLAGASFARGMTYILLFLRPPNSVLPSRPPSELLASFGLIAGGIMFMASSSDTIKGMVHYNLDAMFMYTVTMGCVGLVMAWEIIVLAIKGWAVRKEARSSSTMHGLL